MGNERNNTEGLVEPQDELSFRIWVTRGCYFTMSERLKRKARYSVASVTFLSFYVVALSIIQLIDAQRLSAVQPQTLAAANLILSIFIIVVTLLESSKEYRLEAEFAWDTGQKLAGLHGRLEAKPAAERQATEEAFALEYSEAMTAVRNQRSTIDYIVFRLENAKSFRLGFWERVDLRIEFVWNATIEYWLYVALIVVPPLAGWHIFS